MSETTAVLCDFDGGPFHDGERWIAPDPDGALPTILVTDEGDYWVTYVLLDAHDMRPRPVYSYDGGASESEIKRERCVPTGDDDA